MLPTKNLALRHCVTKPLLPEYLTCITASEGELWNSKKEKVQGVLRAWHGEARQHPERLNTCSVPFMLKWRRQQRKGRPCCLKTRSAMSAKAQRGCLELFNGKSPGSLHKMSRRFLVSGFSSLGQQPLHNCVVRMAAGKDVCSISSPDFSHWVSALACACFYQHGGTPSGRTALFRRQRAHHQIKACHLADPKNACFTIINAS